MLIPLIPKFWKFAVIALSLVDMVFSKLGSPICRGLLISTYRRHLIISRDVGGTLKSLLPIVFCVGC